MLGLEIIEIMENKGRKFGWNIVAQRFRVLEFSENWLFVVEIKVGNL